MTRYALVLLNLGGPDSLEAVEPCPVWLQGNVTLQTREQPPALKPVTSTDVIEVTVVHE